MEGKAVNLFDLLLYIIKGWRSLLLCMLVMAIAISGLQYIRTVKNTKALPQVESVTGEDEKKQAAATIEELRTEMTSDELKAVDKVVRLEKEYNQQMKYLQSSTLMTMNPSDVFIAKLQYWVNTGYKVDYTGITEKDNTLDIVNSYINVVEDSSWQEKAVKEIGTDMEQEYFSELVSTESASSSFTVVIKFPNKGQLETIVKILEKELTTSTSQMIEIFGDYKLNLVNESINATVDNDIYNLQQSRKNILLNLENNIASYKNAFNDKQKSIYAGKIVLDNEASDTTEPEKSVENHSTQFPAAPSISLAYILLGAILGAFIICMLRVMQYMFSNKLKIEDLRNNTLGATAFGYIEEKKKLYTGLFGKVDAWIDGLTKRGYEFLSEEQQILMVVSNIALYCSRDCLKNLYFNSAVNCMEGKALKIREMLSAKGIIVNSGYSILQDVSSMEAMDQADAVVFFEQVDKSRYDSIERELQLCREHKKTVLGFVVLG